MELQEHGGVNYLELSEELDQLEHQLLALPVGEAQVFVLNCLDFTLVVVKHERSSELLAVLKFEVGLCD